MTFDPLTQAPNGLPRVRALGIVLPGQPGPGNAITDVAGVRVGMRTLITGDGPLHTGHGPVRTGVTAILPRGRDGVGDPCAAAVHVLNGNGEMTGTHWVEESGSLTTPIALTNSHAVGPCHRGIIDWVLREHPTLGEGWLLPVVAETYDGWLNDINGDHVTPATAIAALDAAVDGPVPEGSVGGGTGMMCYGFKGGTGTASRVFDFAGRRYTTGVLVQANFGARDELMIAGLPAGRLLGREQAVTPSATVMPPGAGSVLVIIATDAPLLPHQCKALARRASLGLARTGATGSHFSGDLFLAFSTANSGALLSRYPRAATERLATLEFLPWGHMDPLYAACVHAVEEAVLNALIANTGMTGRDGNHVPALPRDRLAELIRAHGAPRPSTMEG